MKGQHHYKATITWTGNKGAGTTDYTSYERSYEVAVVGKPTIFGSSDAAFRGDATKYNPEDLLVTSLSSCHMLWYLHLCSAAGVIVVDYTDDATGLMTETSDGGGHFAVVTLNPVVTVKELSMVETAHELHKKANKLCFIANSVNFPVYHKPTIRVA